MPERERSRYGKGGPFNGGNTNVERAQLARVPRLNRLITEIKTNPRQTPEPLYRTLGISRSHYFGDKTLLEKAFGFKVQFNRAKRSYEIRGDTYLPIVDLKLSEAFALILAVRRLSASGDYILTYEAIEGVKKIVASAQPELRSLLQNILDETVWREGFGCDASILEALRQACADHHHSKKSNDCARSLGSSSGSASCTWGCWGGP
jgi:predicted DNA-binding transcriptional regulator YafY